MKSIFFLSLILVSYFIYGLFINQIDLSVLKPAIVKENPDGFYDYKGLINVHSNRSMGTSTPETLSLSAKLAGLDFMILTDLNHFESSPSTVFYNNALSMIGNKYSYLDSRIIHYSPQGPFPLKNLGEAQIKLSDLLSQKSFNNKNHLIYLAHPYELGFTWTGSIPEGMDGIEVVNLAAIAKKAWKNSKISMLWSLVIYPFNSRLALIRLYEEPTEELLLFDKISAQRHFVGFAGTEASARATPYKGFMFKFPSYQKVFEIASNHLVLNSELTGNYFTDKIKIYKALKEGQFYISMDLLGNPKGFNFVAENEGSLLPMGSETVFKKNTFLKITLPSIPIYKFEVILYKNGESIAQFQEKEVSYEIKEPGAYRLQVKVKPPWPLPDTPRWITWIFTNPIFFKENVKP